MNNLVDQVTAWSSAAVAFFAIVQVLLAWWDRRDRLRAAYHIVRSEWSRHLMLVARWQDEDLVKLADGQALDAAELSPPDVAQFTSGLTLLGHGTAVLGSAGFNFMMGAVRNTDLLRVLAAQARPESRTKQQTDLLRDLERRTKYSLKEAALLLEDALKLAPAWPKHEQFDLGDPQSDLGKRLLEEIRKVPLSRFGRVRRATATFVRAIARRIEGAPRRQSNAA
jgi:hypothetical protein